MYLISQLSDPSLTDATTYSSADFTLTEQSREKCKFATDNEIKPFMIVSKYFKTDFWHSTDFDRLLAITDSNFSASRPSQFIQPVKKEISNFHWYVKGKVVTNK